MKEIQSIIATLLKREHLEKTPVLIRIECPFASGIRISCKKQTDSGERSFCIPGLAHSLYKIVQAEKSRHSFNVAEIFIRDIDDYDVNYIYDKELQARAEAAVM